METPAPANSHPTRDLQLDSLKGFLILMVVLGHSRIGIAAGEIGDSFVGQFVLRIFQVLPPIYYFHIALFFTVAALHLPRFESAPLLRRLALLVVPYLFWQCWPVLEYWLTHWLGASPRDPFWGFLAGACFPWLKDQISRAAIGDWEHLRSILWFLPAMCSLLVVVTPLQAFMDDRSKPIAVRILPVAGLLVAWGLIFANFSDVAQAHVHGRIPWGADVAVYLAPFALLHLAVYRNRSKLGWLSTPTLLALVFLAEIALTRFEPVKEHSPYHYRIDFAQFSVPSTLLGVGAFGVLITSIFLVFLRLPAWRPLCLTGRYSMPIYVLHYGFLQAPFSKETASSLGKILALPEATVATLALVGSIAIAVAMPILISVLAVAAVLHFAG